MNLESYRISNSLAYSLRVICFFIVDFCKNDTDDSFINLSKGDRSINNKR